MFWKLRSVCYFKGAVRCYSFLKMKSTLCHQLCFYSARWPVLARQAVHGAMQRCLGEARRQTCSLFSWFLQPQVEQQATFQDKWKEATLSSYTEEKSYFRSVSLCFSFTVCKCLSHQSAVCGSKDK